MLLEQELRDSIEVPRWAIVRTIKDQSLAEHSYFVTLYVYLIVKELRREFGQEISMEDCLGFALIHDLDETVTGDPPGPIKRFIGKERWENADKNMFVDERFPWLRTSMAFHKEYMGDFGYFVYKFCDMLDAILFLTCEKSLGNKKVEMQLVSLVGQLVKMIEDAKISNELKVFFENTLRATMEVEEFEDPKAVIG